MNGRMSGKRSPAEVERTSEVITYEQQHERIKRARGKASEYDCLGCDERAYHWAYDHGDPDQLRGLTRSSGMCAYSLNVDRYMPLCQICHKRFDSHTKPVSPCTHDGCGRVAIKDELCSPHYVAAWKFMPIQQVESPVVEPEEFDEFGLCERDHRVLAMLVGGWAGDAGFRGGPVGHPRLANATGFGITELVGDIEPRLIAAGLLERRNYGRYATRAAYLVAGLPVPPMLNGWTR